MSLYSDICNALAEAPPQQLLEHADLIWRRQKSQPAPTVSAPAPESQPVQPQKSPRKAWKVNLHGPQKGLSDMMKKFPDGRHQDEIHTYMQDHGHVKRGAPFETTTFRLLTRNGKTYFQKADGVWVMRRFTHN